MNGLEKLKTKALTKQEMQLLHGGYGWLRELFKGALSGELVNGVKEFYVELLDAYVDACASGTYEGIPGCRR